MQKKVHKGGLTHRYIHENRHTLFKWNLCLTADVYDSARNYGHQPKIVTLKCDKYKWL